MSEHDDSKLTGNSEYPQTGFSSRERAAIDLCVPESGTLWIDAMILEARRQRLVGQALQGYLAGRNYSAYPSGYSPKSVARDCCAYADAMIAELKGGSE